MKRTLLCLALVLALGGVLAAALAGRPDPRPAARDSLRRHFAAHGLEETGSINLVSSIILGYRAFDTLGETIVLFLAVTGVMALRGNRE